ncbi:DNA-3-methyladenine glycosylase [Aquibacillus albus]|uniref:Putative 3-methyladenine DNA glycosylase n=1 Tax=Aquibacillus albus TaxID=1168171 RepID=A0ABS2MZ69_9BACI|nr:DNA-3-methyladenine glycosylase [Aquibacillus albus]MBM7571190.1 DNA-3-methyladenine glycosylase [Aquibacillus albus]
MVEKIKINQLKPIERAFYKQPTLQLAKALLGCILIKRTEEGTAAGIITETEGYIGPNDRAAHSYRNRRTKRTEIMYGEAGHAYIYTMHTHNLFNVVSGERDKPEAVLVRGLEPFYNKTLMTKRRPKAHSDIQLCNGPGKLTKALGITLADYGHLLTEEPLWLAYGNDSSFQVASGPRIGIDNAGEAKDYPWRFWIEGNRYISK